MKKIIPIIIAAGLAKSAFGISPADINEIENLVKNNLNVMKGTYNLNGNYSDSYMLNLGDLEFKFNDIYFSVSEEDKNGIVTSIYDFGKDGISDGVIIYSKEEIPPFFDLCNIFKGDLSKIDFKLRTAKLRREIGEKGTNLVFGFHPDGNLVEADFINGSFKKEKDLEFREALNERYDKIMNNLKDYLKPKKDDLYKRK